ncbi:enhancer of polycomb-like-domain-containing protein [Daedaleopsis nitida]|nr:enhancer of polycomb-like-domain-containing protein [Daedaleopsis nitida]
MPRATHPGPAALRNRNRVTNKTRLKVIRDTIDADSIVLDEDEEKARVVSTAGVDAEDANEHHLQAVLSAAASRHQATRATRSGGKESAPTAYIPTPDSTGVVQNYEDLYQSGRWRDPFSYVKSSDTIEEATSYALANGFIYYMDERDKEWLDKNNEQARGEGMSSQAASSSTRSGRSAKAKGKEPDVVQAVSINEDEFELVMAIFEKITHEKTEFLHHVSVDRNVHRSTSLTWLQGLEQGAPFPPFSDYQDTFGNLLRPDLFAVYAVPDWVPPPQQMARFARIIYSYWRERRLERGGHRIIPAVNLDESDTKNESYICFRRREIKAVRKTRASQASYSDRLSRLQSELSTALEIVRLVHQREVHKREASSHNHNVWDKRHVLADLKRAHPSLATKEDDDLYLDKEKPPKKPKLDAKPSLKLRQPRDMGDTGSPVAPLVPLVRPKERQANIQAMIEQDLQRCKERDNKWEDASDYPYQAAPSSQGCRFFKQISSKSSHHDEDSAPYKFSIRVRAGRGGRKVMDRVSSKYTLRSADFGSSTDERDQRLLERFRYDADEGVSVGCGTDDSDRKLIDECQPRHLTVTMSLLQVEDHNKLSTDATLKLASGEVRPFHLGPLPPTVMRPSNPPQRQPSVPPVASVGSASSSQATMSNVVNGTPVAVSTPVKKLPQPSNSLAHLRISSNGGLRSVSGSNGTQHPTSPHATPPSSATPSVNGFAEAQGSPVKTEPDVKPSLNGVVVQPDAPVAVMASPSPAPSKPLTSTAVNVPNLSNGYHISAVNGYPAMAKAAGYMHTSARPNGLSLQQMQHVPAVTMLPDNMRQQGAYVMPNTAYSMQMANSRMQWPMAAQHSPPSNGIALDGPATSASAGSPSRAPSTNGIRAPQIARGGTLPGATQVLNANQALASPAGSHIARLAPHSPSPHMLSPNLAAAQGNVHSSPTRPPQTIPTPSPSLQSRQLVGGSGAAGY